MSINKESKKDISKITIFYKDYDINTTISLNLSYKNLTSLPESIEKLNN